MSQRPPGDWTPPTALWTVKRAPRTIENLLTGYEKPLVEGAPLKVGSFDLAAASPMAMARAALPGGIGWYRKAFAAPALRGGERIQIQFDGAYSESEVWLNGVKLGTNVYGFGAFSFDMTSHIWPGQRNVLAVRVANVGNTARWYTGSGINRHVWLSVTGPVRIAPWGVAVSPPSATASAAQVLVDVELENHLTTPASVLQPAGRCVGRDRDYTERDEPVRPKSPVL